MQSKNRSLKEAKVAEIKEKLEKAQGVVLSEYQGLNVEEDPELGIEGLDQYLQGPVSIALGYDDPTSPARVLNDFAKTHKKLQLKAGVVQGELFGEAQIKEIASIPSRDVLIAKLLGSFKAPLSNLAYLLNAIAEKKGEEAAE